MVSRAAKLGAHSADERPGITVCGRSVASPDASETADILLRSSFPDIIARRIEAILDIRAR